MMNKLLHLVLLSAGVASGVTATGQIIKGYDRQAEGRHVTAWADLSQNMGSALTSNNGNKSTFAPFFRLGIQYRYHFSPKFYFGSGLGLGIGNFRYRYNKTYAPDSDTTYPTGVLGGGGKVVPVFEPHITLGYFFDIADKHRIDVAAGVSLPFYLAKITTLSDTLYSTSRLSTGERMRLGTTEEVSMNDRNGHFANGNANLYIGYKRLHYNELTDRLSIGLIFSYSFYNSNAALSVTRSYNVSYHYQMGNDVVQKLSYASFGIRVGYDLF